MKEVLKCGLESRRVKGVEKSGRERRVEGSLIG